MKRLVFEGNFQVGVIVVCRQHRNCGLHCSLRPMALNAEQQGILSLAEKGHNILITGQCGTGKTHILRCVIKALSRVKKVAVTATTGIASLHLGKQATTLHHWAGIFDGRYSDQKLQELFESDDRFSSAKSRILECECLVIDEIGMLSAKVFQMVDSVCRHIRKSHMAFGGLQVVASGDFKQLPPVPNYRLQDDGAHCFTSPTFSFVFPHHIKLDQVVRQEEMDLITAINELCDGNPSQQTFTLLQNLNNPLPDNVEIIRLFGKTLDVKFVNQKVLDEVEGEQFTYKAIDEGKVSLLLGCVAPKNLALKKGAPVILTRNLGGGFFNGLRGKVHQLEINKPPVIDFEGKVVSMDRSKFEIFDMDQNKTLATRTQYPIILAYAMTAHRAQGQTLEYVEVDCKSFFAPGQMGVAVGRARRKSGLRILNFNKWAACLKHKQVVYDFYEKGSMEPLQDLSCCYLEPHEVSSYASYFSAEDVLDQDESEVLEALETELPIQSWVLNEYLQMCECPFDVNNFLLLHKDSTFLSKISDDKLKSQEFHDH